MGIKSELLKEIAGKITINDEPINITIRALLESYGAKRRRDNIAAIIEKDLEINHLNIEPHYMDGDLDTSIRLTKKLPSTNVTQIESQVSAGHQVTISNLKRLISEALTTSADTSIHNALFAMNSHDYSQLPVTDETGKKIIGLLKRTDAHRAVMASPSGIELKVGRVMTKTENINKCVPSDSLFMNISGLIENGYIVVVDSHSTLNIVGILSSYDLNVFFRQRTEPILLLEMIERNLKLILKNFAVTEVYTSKGKSIDELTMGGILHAFQVPVVRAKIPIGLDYPTFLMEVNMVRELRNELMHFASSPDELDRNDIQRLQSFSNLLVSLLELNTIGDKAAA